MSQLLGGYLLVLAAESEMVISPNPFLTEVVSPTRLALVVHRSALVGGDRRISEVRENDNGGHGTRHLSGVGVAEPLTSETLPASRFAALRPRTFGPCLWQDGNTRARLLVIQSTTLIGRPWDQCGVWKGGCPLLPGPSRHVFEAADATSTEAICSVQVSLVEHPVCEPFFLVVG